MIKKWFMLILTFCCIGGKVTAQNDTVLKLWYASPARQWVEALPLGNGSLGAMVFGDPIHERFQLNEETVWGGSPHNNTNPKAKEALPRIRQLIFEGKNKEAQELCGPAICSQSANGMPYQTVGTLHLDFEGISKYDDYYRDLDIEKAIATHPFHSQWHYLRTGNIHLISRPVISYQTNSLEKKKHFFHCALHHSLYRKHRAPHLFPQRIATQRKGQRPRRH